jgi:hypothetical protein
MGAATTEWGSFRVVAAAQPERGSYFDQCQEQAGWREIIREPSPRKEGQRKVRLLVELSSAESGWLPECRPVLEPIRKIGLTNIKRLS